MFVSQQGAPGVEGSSQVWCVWCVWQRFQAHGSCHTLRSSVDSELVSCAGVAWQQHRLVLVLNVAAARRAWGAAAILERCRKPLKDADLLLEVAGLLHTGLTKGVPHLAGDDLTADLNIAATQLLIELSQKLFRHTQ